MTAVGGGPCTGPRKARAPRRRRQRNNRGDGSGGGGGGGEQQQQQNNGEATGGEGSGDAGSGGGGGGGETAPTATEKSSPPKRRERRERREPQPIWHDTLSPEVKQSLQDKNIRTSTGTIDLSYGNARIKLGTRNYASLANEDKVLAEGSFTCDSDGLATFEWKRALRFSVDNEGDGLWNVLLDLKSLVSEIKLTDGE